MSDHLLRAYVWMRSAPVTIRHRLARDEAGEGVISAAMAISQRISYFPRL